mmetsp:Transcript_30986/g.95694  ORF Transcript_30986/g.95694 Transcript_30986/m.95694 type:complete len:436 (-) Transcript_30986:440-1747(-)
MFRRNGLHHELAAPRRAEGRRVAATVRRARRSGGAERVVSARGKVDVAAAGGVLRRLHGAEAGHVRVFLVVRRGVLRLQARPPSRVLVGARVDLEEHRNAVTRRHEGVKRVCGRARPAAGTVLLTALVLDGVGVGKKPVGDVRAVGTEVVHELFERIQEHGLAHHALPALRGLALRLDECVCALRVVAVKELGQELRHRRRHARLVCEVLGRRELLLQNTEVHVGEEAKRHREDELCDQLPRLVAAWDGRTELGAAGRHRGVVPDRQEHAKGRHDPPDTGEPRAREQHHDTALQPRRLPADVGGADRHEEVEADHDGVEEVRNRLRRALAGAHTGVQQREREQRDGAAHGERLGGVPLGAAGVAHVVAHDEEDRGRHGEQRDGDEPFAEALRRVIVVVVEHRHVERAHDGADDGGKIRDPCLVLVFDAFVEFTVV